MKIVKLTAPSHWASYFINGDHSGLADYEREEADNWLESVGYGTPASCDDAGFMWSHDAYNVAPYGADCQEYTFLVRE